MTPLTQAPPLFTDYTISELKSVRGALKENIRLAGKGRLPFMKPVWTRNLVKVNRVIDSRSLKAEA